MAAALRAHARGLPLPVSVNGRGFGRYEQAIEAAIYFCCLEAIQNALRHARASQITVELDGTLGALRFEVVDDGVGFDHETIARAGTGLTNLEDRTSALGGHVQIDSSSRTGTRVSAWLPVQTPASER